MQTKKKAVTFRLDLETIKQLEHIARTDRISKTAAVKMLIWSAEYRHTKPDKLSRQTGQKPK